MTAVQPEEFEILPRLSLDEVGRNLPINRRIFEAVPRTATEHKNIRMLRMPVDKKVMIFGQRIDTRLHLARLLIKAHKKLSYAP